MTGDDPLQLLSLAIARSDQPDGARRIAELCAAGVHRDAVFENGCTPLTEAIQGGMGSSRAVQVLLAHGADPNQRDRNGWTPWGACFAARDNPVVAKRQQRIADLLLEYGADRGDEPALLLQEAVLAGDSDQVEALLAQGVATDAPFIDLIGCAVMRQDVAMLRRLLRHGLSPDGPRHAAQEPPLVQAARDGQQALVELLVAAGADLFAVAYGDPRATAAFLARDAGHTALADGLQAAMDRGRSAPPSEQPPAPRGKFAALAEQQTAGPNVGLTTEALIRQLELWDQRYGVTVSEVTDNALRVTFASLPRDLSRLIASLGALCPELLEGYGDAAGLASVSETAQREGWWTPAAAKTIAAADPEDPSFIAWVLGRSLKATHSIALWWD
jgi:hypothetical protein